eukprot:m.441045 g.441045  ORF g.441045 m.441045 type:complete len:126 (-) comp18609_c0_seq1:1792-2169(-)
MIKFRKSGDLSQKKCDQASSTVKVIISGRVWGELAASTSSTINRIGIRTIVLSSFTGQNFRGSVRGTLHWRQRSAARTCQEKCPPAPTTSIFPLVGLKIALKIGVLRARSASGIRVPVRRRLRVS